MSGRKYILLLIPLFIILLIGSFRFSNSTTAPQATVASEEQDFTPEIEKLIPKDAYLREIKDIPGVKDVKIVTYIINPVFEEPDLNSIQTSCAGVNQGQAIEGVYHLALFENGKLSNGLVIPSAWEYGLKEKTHIQQLAYKNTRSNAYTKFGGEKYSEDEKDELIVVPFLQFGKYTNAENLVDFKILGLSQACGHEYLLYGGYDKKSHELKFYPLIEPDATYDWGDNTYPNANGRIYRELKCGDHGNEIHEVNEYEFDSNKSAYILIDSEKNPCEM